MRLREKQKVAPHLRRARAAVPRLLLRGATRRRAAPARRCSASSSAASTTSSTASASPPTRAEARQLVRHGHVLSTASASTSRRTWSAPGDKVEVREKSRRDQAHRRVARRGRAPRRPQWLELDREKFTGTRQGACRSARTSRCRSASSSSSSFTRGNRFRRQPRAVPTRRSTVERIRSRRNCAWTTFDEERRMTIYATQLARPDSPEGPRASSGDASPRPTASSSCEPLERGFGITLGNSLRRVLLSSLQGAAITAVRIDGALHEFTTIRTSSRT